MDDDFLFEERIDQYRAICVSTLADESVAEEDIAALGSAFGYFIYETSDDPMARGISVIAKCASFEAALRFIDLWRDRSAPRPEDVG